MKTSITSAPSTDHHDAVTDEELSTRPRLQLSASQLIASALAAITATVAASYLGIAGTVIGAALAAVLTVTGNAVYGHSLQRTGARVREAVPAVDRLATRTSGPPRPAPAPTTTRTVRRDRRGRWPVLAAATVGVFVGVLVVVTGFELIAGKPLSDVLRGTSGSGTTLVERTRSDTTPSPQVTITITPAVVTETPTVTVTGSPTTATTSPSATSSGSGSSTPSGSSSPTSTPSSSVTSSGATSSGAPSGQ